MTEDTYCLSLREMETILRALRQLGDCETSVESEMLIDKLEAAHLIIISTHETSAND